MKKRNILLTGLAAATFYLQLLTFDCSASTTVPAGNVSGIWTLAGSPYDVQGSIQIPDGSTLIIEPGVTVNFQGTYKLNVQGRLLATGTISDTIVFTAANTTNGWRGIRFDNTPTTNDTSKIVYCKLQYGKATGSTPNDNGGAFYFNTYSKTIITNCRITESTADSYGGGIYCNNSNPAISNNIISNNSASGVYCTNSSPTISNNSVFKNSTSGIYCESGGPIINNNSISSNSGDGISCNNNSSPNINNNNIFNNTGGGVYSKNSNPIITLNIIDSNSACGIYCEGSNALINNNTISNNIALYSNNYLYSGYGGGISCYAFGNLIISNNIISNNTASAYGGGISCLVADPTISNNTITNNTAASGGGGIWCDASTSTITNNTIANNSAVDGGGLYCFNSSFPNLYNNILWGNTASNSGAQVYPGSNVSNPNFYYCDVQGGKTAFGGSVYTGIYQNNINIDPQFISPSGGSGTGFNGVIANWSLQGNSSCINSGDPGGTYPATDEAGNLRVTVCHIDIGAYEYQNGVLLTAAISQGQQIQCYGDSLATATISASGGAPSDTYTYLWNNGQTTATAVGLKAETYTVTVTETIYGCSITKTITINQPTALSLVPSTTNPICTNNNGSASITASGGTNMFTYLWSTNINDTTNAITDLLAGTYSVMVTDGNGCTKSDSVTLVTQYPSLSLVPSSTDPICTNNNGSASYTASGGTNTFNYLWSSNSNDTTNVLTGLLAGTYSLTVTDGNGCTKTDSVTLVTQYPSLSLVPSTTNPICTNNNGSASITANGGTNTFIYLWSTNSNDTTNTIDSLLAGTYSVTVTDGNGCAKSDSATLVTQFPSISLSPSITNSSCNIDGSISISPNGGTTPYSYTWSNSSSSQNLSGIGGGTYSVYVEDNNGCVISDTVTIYNSIAPNSIPICMVTVDSSSTKNVIVWEKPGNAAIDSFRIYREVASVYTLVGTVSYNALSEFTDNTNGINPNTTSYKYELSVLDTCGNESSLSAEHQTIHVQLGVAFPQGVNLSWNDYVGFTFSQYRILRDDLGNGNWQAIDSVSYGITTYTSADVLPNARYIVEATKPSPCVSTRQSNMRNSSKSNTASQTTGINELSNGLSILISPNPSDGKFTIELSSPRFTNNKCELKIYNVLGEGIYLSELKHRTANEIDLSTVPKGIYFVNIYNGDDIYTRKIVKQ